MKIIVFHGNQPCLSIKHDDVQKCDFGLNRDRQPDTDWGEFRNTRIDDTTSKEVEMTDKLKRILIEDICQFYDGTAAYNKLVEFDLIK